MGKCNALLLGFFLFLAEMMKMKKWTSYWIVGFFFFTACSYRGKEKEPLQIEPSAPQSSIFDPPKNTHVGFDIDGVLHTQVWYGQNAQGEFGQYHPILPHAAVFETTERNPAIKELASQWGLLGNTFSIVTHNQAFCRSNQTKQDQFFAENGLPTPIKAVNCSSRPKSEFLKKEKVTAFVDDSPAVLQEIAYAAPSVRLYMAFPHHHAVAPYFYQTPLEIEQCGMVFVSQDPAVKVSQRRVLLQHRADTNSWQIPHGDCDAKLNRNRTCTKEMPCEDPVTGAFRILHEQAGDTTQIQLSSHPHMEVFHFENLFLLMVKVEAESLHDLHPQPAGLPVVELNTPIANVANSPGYRWFTQEELQAKEMKAAQNPHIRLLLNQYEKNWKEL
jgi:hypothetical protein